ncbi:MAG: DUF1178 family protein [Pusillimonas sp.]
MSLKVFDLQCEQNHVFEGWFSSADNYESQRADGLLSCPVCNSHQVSKKLSAPRLNVSHIKGANEPAARQASAVMAPDASQVAQMQAAALRHIRQIIRNTENVGARFAQEARSMYEGEIEERAIRGTATTEEREELARDGISVVPIPDFLDDERLQ